MGNERDGNICEVVKWSIYGETDTYLFRKAFAVAAIRLLIGGDRHRFSKAARGYVTHGPYAISYGM